MNSKLLGALLAFSLAVNVYSLALFSGAFPAIFVPWTSNHSASGEVTPPLVTKKILQEISPDLWHKFQDGEGYLSSLAVRLRAAGFPPLVVRSIIRNLVHEEIVARRAALVG